MYAARDRGIIIILGQYYYYAPLRFGLFALGIPTDPLYIYGLYEAYEKAGYPQKSAADCKTFVPFSSLWPNLGVYGSQHANESQGNLIFDHFRYPN